MPACLRNCTIPNRIWPGPRVEETEERKFRSKLGEVASVSVEWSAMSRSGAKEAVIPLAAKLNARSDANDPLERAGHVILDMVRQAADNAQASHQ